MTYLIPPEHRINAVMDETGMDRLQAIRRINVQDNAASIHRRGERPTWALQPTWKQS